MVQVHFAASTINALQEADKAYLVRMFENVNCVSSIANVSPSGQKI